MSAAAQGSDRTGAVRRRGHPHPLRKPLTRRIRPLASVHCAAFGVYHLFDLHPSTAFLRNLECDSVSVPRGEEYGYIMVSIQFTKADLMGHRDDMRNYVIKRFDDFFDCYRRMIKYVNDDVSMFNASLKAEIKRLLSDRKKRADSTALICKELAIPLIMCEDAPNTIPIPLKRKPKPPVRNPQRKTIPTEYSIRDEDYKNINNIIYMCGSSMEKTARSHASNDEEELRDFFLIRNGWYTATQPMEGEMLWHQSIKPARASNNRSVIRGEKSPRIII